MVTFKELFGNVASCALMSHFSSSYGLLSTFIFTNCPLFLPTLLLTLCFLSLIIIIKYLFDKKKMSQYSLINEVDTYIDTFVINFTFYNWRPEKQHCHIVL
ncbi:hypothetical protein DBV15_10767, partial [Temnothorax longispinosus]